jgi:hypothetical protein
VLAASLLATPDAREEARERKEEGKSYTYVVPLSSQQSHLIIIDISRLPHRFTLHATSRHYTRDNKEIASRVMPS